MTEFEPLCQELEGLLEVWEPRFMAMPRDLILKMRNDQGRNIKRMVGHLDEISELEKMFGF
jgi:hypothetical protein